MATIIADDDDGGYGPIRRNNAPSPSPPPLQQRRRKTFVLLLLTLPYFVGLLWTASHPLISVITGEYKCRGMYVDENGLDVHRHRVGVYPLERRRTTSSSSFSSSSSWEEEWEGGKEGEGGRRRRRADTTTTAARGIGHGMCDAIDRRRRRSTTTISPSVECLRHDATETISFDVVRILPSVGPVIEMTEAVVLVVGVVGGKEEEEGEGEEKKEENDCGGWYDISDLNASVMHLIERLSSGGDCPWLNKAVFVVSPTAPATMQRRRQIGMNNATSPPPSLVDVVDALVSSYLGGWGDVDDVRRLPPDFTYATIRSLLVLSDVFVDDVDVGGTTIDETSPSSSSSVVVGGDTTRSEVRILPQGTGGALPNLDLVFATYMSLQSYPAGNKFEASKSIYHGGNADFRSHPFGGVVEERVVRAMRRVADVLGLKHSFVEEYSKDLAGLFGFVAAMAIGPPQPHSSALKHGIDALTVEVRVPGNRNSRSTSIHPHYADLTRCVEHLLRSISNLHERLHHSIAQYTMPSPSKFVSHGEYIYPAILVSSPMVVRAATLALMDLRRFQFLHVGAVLTTVCMASVAVGLLAMSTNARRSEKGFASEFILPIAFICAYVLVVYVARRDRSKLQRVADTTEIQGSLRFAACLVGIYLHAPLLLANYSLGFPSSAFWSPLLATLVLPPSMHAYLLDDKVRSFLATVVKGAFLLATAPPIFLVPRIFHSYTVYVSCVYTPLHLLLAVLWLA